MDDFQSEIEAGMMEMESVSNVSLMYGAIGPITATLGAQIGLAEQRLDTRAGAAGKGVLLSVRRSEFARVGITTPPDVGMFFAYGSQTARIVFADMDDPTDPVVHYTVKFSP